jgi:hypothetical protein
LSHAENTTAFRDPHPFRDKGFRLTD